MRDYDKEVSAARMAAEMTEKTARRVVRYRRRMASLLAEVSTRLADERRMIGIEATDLPSHEIAAYDAGIVAISQSVHDAMAAAINGWSAPK